MKDLVCKLCDGELVTLVYNDDNDGLTQCESCEQIEGPVKEREMVEE